MTSTSADTATQLTAAPVPDDTAAIDPVPIRAVEAHRIQALFGGVTVWFGYFTREWWAMVPPPARASPLDPRSRDLWARTREQRHHPRGTPLEVTMTVTTDRAAMSATAPRDLISAGLFDRIVGRAAAEYCMPVELAERSLVQTLTMLHAIATHPGTAIHPPRVVDVTWHTLMLHTVDYVELCNRLAGHYLHHSPADGAIDGGAAVRESAATLRSLGYEIDEGLWAMIEATACENACSGCDNSVD
ncbi:MAG: hypothetical protein ACRDNL_11585 [Spirillospora sp.]